MDKNIFEILGVAFKEDVISNFLVETINDSKIFAEKFLEQICEVKDAYKYNCIAYTRIVTLNYGIPDIIIKATSPDETYFIIIENKLKAEEGYKQTIRYSSDACLSELKNKIGIDEKEHLIPKYIFLTLIPEQIPNSQLFINKTYKDLLDKCSDLRIEDSVINKLFSDYMIVLSQFYNGLEIDENNFILSVLQEDIEPEKIFIRFKNIMNSIIYPNVLKVHCSKTGGRGRVSYIAQIYKDAWNGVKMVQNKNEKWKLDSHSYNIHFEAAFDILNKVFSIPLHYETYPYEPERRIKDYADLDTYEIYNEYRQKVRIALQNEIETNNIKDIRMYNGYNQILNIKININENTTIKQFKEKIVDITGFISNIIDNILINLD